MRGTRAALALLVVAAAVGEPGCARSPAERGGPVETFHWCREPISFAPPPRKWRREGDSSGGMLGVRFVLTGGVGECIGVGAYTTLAERDRSAALRTLIVRRDSLEEHEFLRQVSLARAPTDDPVSDRDAAASIAINAALDRAVSDRLGEHPGFVGQDLEAALHAASSYRPTLAELLPRLRLKPARMQEPDRWRIGYERDTTIAGQPAFASDDTLIAPERRLLYREILWVVNGCAFKATYQGLPAHLPSFLRLVSTIAFPESTRVGVP